MEFTNIGWDALQRAMEKTVHCDAADALFVKATESFQDVTVTGLLNWGNVYQTMGQKRLSVASQAGKSVADVQGEVLALFDKAEQRWADVSPTRRCKESVHRLVSEPSHHCVHQRMSLERGIFVCEGPGWVGSWHSLTETHSSHGMDRRSGRKQMPQEDVCTLAERPRAQTGHFVTLA